ncbi:MAG: Na/Pi cotransporter family protein, partial [Elusimicrobiota bacterium]
MNTFMMVLNLIGALGIFLYGLKVMSEGLQKAAGPRLRDILAKATDNRFMGTFSGFVVTCCVQSSSATTVMVVGFCSAGLMTLYQSLGVIFGANIGTTTTAWLISLLGFKVKIANFAVPLIGIGFFSQFIKKWRTPHRVGEALVGFGLLFLGLSILKETIPDVKDAPQLLDIISRFSPETIPGMAYAIFAGFAMTVVVQSSSASMAITLTAAAKGLIDFPTAAALVIGQNIGTTTTAVLAAIGAPLTARRAALAHFLFNVIGVVPAIIFFRYFLAGADALLPGDPYAAGVAGMLAIPTHLALFHTAFNVVNTALFLPFARQFERLIIYLMPEDVSRERKEHDLLYMTTPFAATPELEITAAQKEVDRMAGVTVRMIGWIKEGLKATNKDLPAIAEKIRKDERTTDILEHKINEYLAQLIHGHLSTPASKETLSLLSMINDLERIGDHGETIARLLLRARDEDVDISQGARADLLEMARAVDTLLRATQVLILEREPDPMP